MKSKTKKHAGNTGLAHHCPNNLCKQDISKSQRNHITTACHQSRSKPFRSFSTELPHNAPGEAGEQLTQCQKFILATPETVRGCSRQQETPKQRKAARDA
jgi:hypothetical protein